jgi:hypothetical protein
MLFEPFLPLEKAFEVLSYQMYQGRIEDDPVPVMAVRGKRHILAAQHPNSLARLHEDAAE